MTADKWLLDLPQQFLGKKNIEVLIKTFSKQMDELEQVYEDLKYATTLENAKGQNLKNIGDVLSLSMKDAQAILMVAGNNEITDETYRKVLQYKTLQNNCDCTYEDIMESIALLWDANNIKYVEKPENPATVFILLPEAKLDGIDPSVGRVLAIKPAGVSMIYTVAYKEGVNISGIEKSKVPMIVATTDIQNEENATSKKVQLKMKTNVGEKMTLKIIVRKNFWKLDGTYMLDGTKMLDAENIEEVL